MDSHRRSFLHQVFVGTSLGETQSQLIDVDHLLINVDHFKVLSTGLVEKLRETVMYTNFSEIKRYSSDTTVRVQHFQRGLRVVPMRVPTIREKYTKEFSESLKWLRVPKAEHEAITESIFRAVDVAPTFDTPIDVAVWDVTDFPNFIPRRPRGAASQSSIQALEQLELSQADVEQAIIQTPSCPICFNDFDVSLATPKDRITRLPCSHHYHLHCIVQWLQRSHFCPMCRNPLPTDEQPN
ncbi:hypothetical protein ACHQM5_021928 [Ranunculus cassubicifolius]